MAEERKITKPEKISFILNAAKPKAVKPPAYQWQDLALRIIKEFGVPPFKKGSVFKICRDNPKETVERAMNETKELCKTGQRYLYFFKVIDNYQAGVKKSDLGLSEEGVDKD